MSIFARSIVAFASMLLLVLVPVAAFAQWAPPSASPQLPQYIVAPDGTLFLKANPEHRPPMQFRCISAAVSTSCTTLHPDLNNPGDRKAITWVRNIITAAIREGGADPWRSKVRFEWSPDVGLAGGYFAIVNTDTGEKAINALWPALWIMLPGETEATVRDRIREALKGGF